MSSSSNAPSWCAPSAPWSSPAAASAPFFGVCANCRKHATPPTLYANCPCKLAAYCSTDCQKQDRKVHKRVCTVLRGVKIGSASAARSAAGHEAVTEMLKKIGMPFSFMTADQIDRISAGQDAWANPETTDSKEYVPFCYRDEPAVMISMENKQRWLAIGTDVV